MASVNDARGGDLRQEAVGALDGSGDQVGEVQHGQEKVAETARGVELAAVDVDGIREGLKCIKRYSDREDHTERPEVGVEVDDVEQVLEGGGKEVEVFEEGEQANIGGDAQGEIFAGFVVRFAGFGESLHAGGAVVIDASGEEEGDKEAPVPTGIEEAAGDQQEGVLAGMRQAIVDGENDRQKGRKLKGIK